MDPNREEKPKEGWSPFIRSWSRWLRYATTSYLVYAITDDGRYVFAETKLENCVVYDVNEVTSIPLCKEALDYSC